ncbi:MAG: glycosyltransferase family 39 protein [Nitrospirae bacterium YQR-1]
MESVYFAKRKIRYILALLGLCATFACIAVVSVKDDGLTIDEIVHIPSGFAALRDQNFIINLEHPPLYKMIAAVPLLFQNINYKTDLIFSGSEYESNEINTFYTLNKSNYDNILFAGRVALIVFNTFLLFILGMLLRQIISPVPALLGVFFIAFEPNFFAHARYITTDAGVALFSVLSLTAFGIFLKKQRSTYLYLTALFLGAALLSKFSAILIYLFILVFQIFYELKQFFKPDGVKTFKKIFFNSALILIAPWLLVYLVIFGAAMHVNTNQLNYKIKNGLHTTESTSETSIFLRPVFIYKIGFNHVTIRSRLGHQQSHLPQYLNGEVRVNKGWWYYFPLALLYKETPTLLVLFALSLILFWRKNTEAHPLEKLLLFFSGIYLCVSITSDLNIGIRHILPMITSLTLQAIMLLSRQQFWLKYKLWYGAVAFQLFSLISIYPYYTAYFNVFAGGPANGYKHLLDSNLDWGQNLKRLYFWAQKNKIESITVHSWMETYSDLFDEGKIFKHRLSSENGKPKGYLAISITAIELGGKFLPKGYERLERMYLRNMKPVAVVAHSFLVYHFP